MYKKIKYLFFLFFFSTNCLFAQVDVIYNDLVWSDEFDVNGAVNSTKWHHQTQLPAGGSWYNGEVQHYTNELANSNVNGGFLNIVAKKEPYTSQGVTKQYTSARLNSKFAFKYGRVDVRAKLPIDAGTWPAIWMLGKNINEDGGFFDAAFGTTNWPACGEIDIMEHGITPSQPVNYIQSALHTPSSYGNTSNIGGAIANNLGSDYHVYSMNWSPNQITFLLDGVAFYTYSPAVKTINNWPFDLEQYLLLNIAMGGIAGTINPAFTESAMVIDYVRVYQNVQLDTQIPTNFTATIGNVTNSSIELLLKANDNSGNINYNVSYNATSINSSGISNIQKSLLISGLSPNTNYTFSVAASDLSGNNAANNSVILNATTLDNISCTGTSSLAQINTFSNGYTYNFETIGTDVKITFTLLDTDKVDVFAYLWKQSPFSETTMTKVSGNTFTKTITGQTIGATINYGVKFAYRNGMSVTQYIPYVVGTNCVLSQNEYNDFEDFTFSNPAHDYINITSKYDIDKVEIYSLFGNKVLSKLNSNQVEISNLSTGVYLLVVYSGDKKGMKKVIIN
jgi:beta-glucanase (GH16 family)